MEDAKASPRNDREFEAQICQVILLVRAHCMPVWLHFFKSHDNADDDNHDDNHEYDAHECT